MDGRRVSGLMLCDLKFQKLEDSGKSVGIGCRDHQASASWRFLILVVNFVLQLFHYRNAWRGGVVDKHRNRKVAAGEGLRDGVHPRKLSEKRALRIVGACFLLLDGTRPLGPLDWAVCTDRVGKLPFAVHVTLTLRWIKANATTNACATLSVLPAVVLAARCRALASVLSSTRRRAAQESARESLR